MTSTAAPTATSGPLISADALRALLAARTGDDAPVLVDCSFDLADTSAGARAFAQGHVPGARYAHLDQDLSGPKTGRNGRHPLPARDAFAGTLAQWGVRPGRLVVAMDRQGGMYAARLWWMLRWMGHAQAQVLDGGVAAWQAAGGPMEDGEPRPVAAAPLLPAAAPAAPTLDADAVAAQLAAGAITVIDARAAERFRGEVEPLDARAGHIPGAVNRFFKDNLDATTGRFLPPEALRTAFRALLAGEPATVVHQCGSGVTACHNLLAMEVAGLAGSALYPGSWSEWSSDPSRPVATGA